MIWKNENFVDKTLFVYKNNQFQLGCLLMALCYFPLNASSGEQYSAFSYIILRIHPRPGINWTDDCHEFRMRTYIANNMDPDQTAPCLGRSLIRVHSVCFHDEI